LAKRSEKKQPKTKKKGSAEKDGESATEENRKRNRRRARRNSKSAPRKVWGDSQELGHPKTKMPERRGNRGQATEFLYYPGENRKGQIKEKIKPWRDEEDVKKLGHTGKKKRKGNLKTNPPQCGNSDKKEKKEKRRDELQNEKSTHRPVRRMERPDPTRDREGKPGYERPRGEEKGTAKLKVEYQRKSTARGSDFTWSTGKG